jgi:hypothetical protein
MNCDTITKQLSLMLYGELTFDEEEHIHQHLETCAPCQSEYRKVRELHNSINSVQEDVPPALLQDCRRNLRIGVAALSQSGTARKPGLFDSLRAWLPTWGLDWKAAGALGLLAIGFLGGRVLPSGSLRGVGLLGQPEPSVTRVRYVQPADDGRVQIVVEEVRQRVLSGNVDDGRIRSLLVAASREANDPGVRVETMSLLKSQTESIEVRRALLAALRNDTNPGVRLKALEALRETQPDSDTRRVLTEVLLTDDNPGIRTQAIDLLTQRRERSMVGVCQELMDRESNDYVRSKCQRALLDMKASVETF